MNTIQMRTNHPWLQIVPCPLVLPVVILPSLLAALYARDFLFLIRPRYADDTTLMAESEEELKSLLMKVKEESEKVGLRS